MTGRTGGALPSQTSSGSYDIFIRDYDTNGTELWTTQFGEALTDSRYADSARDVAVKDGIYVVGHTSGPLAGQTSLGETDAYIRKYGMDGNEEWIRQFGTSASDDATSVAVSGSDVYVVGSTRGALPQQTNAGGQDIYIRKYDNTGSEAWTRQFGSTWDDESHGVATDSSGVYIVGLISGSSPYQADAFITKYDTAGSQVWNRQFGTFVDMGWNRTGIEGVAVGDSGLYVVGSTTGALPGQTSAGEVDAFVRKYDTDGNEIWTRQFGTSLQDRAGGVAVDSSGIYVLAELNRDNEMGTTVPTSIVRKYDADGNEVWTQEFGLPDGTYARGIAVDGAAIYVTGGTLGAFNGQLSAGSQDGFVLKFGLNGSQIWAKQFGTSNSDQMHGIAVTESGVYVAGETGGYSEDAVVLKLSKEAVLLSFLYLPAVNR